MTNTFIIFHLNLAYSSISEALRETVIRQCYWPMLRLAETTGIPIGIELTSWTLKIIQEMDPTWITALKKCLNKKQCEIIGSGYTQMIAPLVPYEINRFNQKTGLLDYQSILNHKPNLALVNEMAFSTSLVELYQEAGYHGIIMDRDNVKLALGLQDEDYEMIPTHAIGLNQSEIPVLWTDSILFQQLQRYVHGDTRLNDYLQILKKRKATATRPLAIYCNDAEIFDFRPGRYQEESPLHSESEWDRLKKLLQIITTDDEIQWLSPSDALAKSLSAIPHSKKILTSIRQPIPVKKQAKYNISRWAISGRHDLWINTLCHRLARAIKKSPNENQWRRLCELWSSDLRTHITEERWNDACKKIGEMAKELNVTEDYASPLTNSSLPQTTSVRPHSAFSISEDEEKILFTIASEKIKLILNRRRGLTIHALAFQSHHFTPLVGILPHGYFDSIEYSADFYSAGTILEFPNERQRITDLERVEPTIEMHADTLIITGYIPTKKGMIVKRYTLFADQEKIQLQMEFPEWKRGQSILRLGNITLLPEAFSSNLVIENNNGGPLAEHFILDAACHHAEPVSSLVSCTTGFGATTGECIIGDKNRKLKLQWDPSICAAFPMLSHHVFKKNSLTRIHFSLGELDETMKPGGDIPPFHLTLSPENRKGENHA